MDSGLISEGLVLMLAGMGTVFAFLTTLVVAMTLMAKLLQRFHVIEPPAGVTAEEVAAISAAIAAYRKYHGSNGNHER
jgi:oxaloacetate decarboxylase gamma subunit